MNSCWILILLVHMVVNAQDSAPYFAASPSPDSITEGEPWPIPQKIEYGRQNRTVRRGAISIVFDGLKDTDCDILSNAKNTYQYQWFFPNRFMVNHSPISFRLVVRTDGKCPEKDEYPQHDMNEEYFLQVPQSGDAILEADEVWGVLRGLETFSQLIFQKSGQYYIRTATIHDWPEYPLRGVLLDTSRHYLPKKTILRQLDLMAQNKFNLLHWHIVDSQSFPYVSRKFPHLSERGAYTPQHIYSKNDVQAILDHAKMRGIRVMAEFDTPGHMGSWKAELGLLAECKDVQGHIIPSNIIDPTADRNYVFLKNFFDEVLSVFPERFIHLGGDEADFWLDCWRSNPKIRDFMEHKGFGNNTTLLENYYYSKLQDVVAELFGTDKNSRMVFWQEVFQFNNPRPNTIAHLWQYDSDEHLKKAISQYTSQGHPVIVSSGWYLNYISFGKDYDKYYYKNPRDFNGTEEQKKLVLGGIACVWGEYLNSANLESTLWPRASAVAERLWSSVENTRDADKAWPRLHEHSCRLNQRGYRSAPLNGPDFCVTEYEEA